MKIRTYSELMTIPSFEERYEYLRLDGRSFEETFGFDRYLNQEFYHSNEWKQLRNKIIVRDNACDLAVEGYDINSKIIIHHMNPIRQNDILNLSEYAMNPEYLICVSHRTHNAIHYGDIEQVKDYTERRVGDTKLW